MNKILLSTLTIFFAIAAFLAEYQSILLSPMHSIKSLLSIFDSKTVATFGTVDALKTIVQSPPCRQIHPGRHYSFSSILCGIPRCQPSLRIQSPSLFAFHMLTREQEDSIQENDGRQNMEKVWNMIGLKNEVDRLIQRAHKKIDKAQQRIHKSRIIADNLSKNPSATLEDYESCPDIVPMEIELNQLQERLKGLNQLQTALLSIKNNSNVNMTVPDDVSYLAMQLNVSDRPPGSPSRGPTKKKGPSQATQGPRKPYRVYYSYDDIEIRVGKKADDNDELSLSPQHRDGSDWWMHASGCPGSHVVIRYQQHPLPNEILYDAASLAARYSKCFQNSYAGTIRVSLTRCRDVKKPMGAKPGLVTLTGKVKTITVNMKDAEKRLDRLEKSSLVS